MGPNELLITLDTVSKRLHDCGQASFVSDEESEVWHVACGAVDALTMIVRARNSGSTLKRERAGTIRGRKARATG